jgi:hypothetical protein
MSLYDEIIKFYPELTLENFDRINGEIKLYDDGDGIPYIKEWNYSKPIPDGLKLGK